MRYRRRDRGPRVSRREFVLQRSFDLREWFSSLTSSICIRIGKRLSRDEECVPAKPASTSKQLGSPLRGVRLECSKPSARVFSRPMSEDSFSSEVTKTGTETVIHVRGEIDLATAGVLRDAIELHMGPEQVIVLDFSEVEFMDSSCLSVLVEARTTLTTDGGSLVLRNPSRAAHVTLTAGGSRSFSKLRPGTARTPRTEPICLPVVRDWEV